MVEIDQTKLRTLQVIAAVIISFAIIAPMLAGEPIGRSIITGLFAGGASFILTAIGLFVYWGIGEGMTLDSTD